MHFDRGKREVDSGKSTSLSSREENKAKLAGEAFGKNPAAHNEKPRQTDADHQEHSGFRSCDRPSIVQAV